MLHHVHYFSLCQDFVVIRVHIWYIQYIVNERYTVDCVAWGGGWVISNRFLSSLDQLSVRQLHLHRVILIPVCYQTVNRARNVFDVLVVKSQPVGRLHAEKSIKTLPLNA